MARARTHYEVLGVAPHASHDEIRRAYRALAQRHHPDANPAPTGRRSEAGSSAMARINAAWEVLGEPERRRTYDLAIGVTPRPRLHFDGVTSDDDDDDSVEHLSDEPFVPVRQRPSDILVAIPVFMAIIAVATFALSTLSQNSAMRTAAILMAPVTGGAFVAAPLFAMLRSRSRDDR